MNNSSLGPWTIQELPHRNAQRRGVSYAIRDARNCCLAEVGEIDAIHDGEESAANARLIAAAPDLLAALKLADVHLGWGDTSLENVHQILRAAIANAEGRERGEGNHDSKKVSRH